MVLGRRNCFLLILLHGIISVSSNVQTESEPMHNAILMHHYSLQQKYYESNSTNVAGYVLEGDAQAVEYNGATAIKLLPSKQLGAGSVSTYYSALGINGWELSIEFIWHFTDKSALESYDDSPNAPRSGMSIWWATKPFERESDVTLENSIALGGSKAFDGMTISFDAAPYKEGSDNNVNVVGRLSYLPSGNRYRVGDCMHDLRTNRRTRVDIKFVDRTLKVIIGRESEDGTWKYDFCIHSAPVDIETNERFISISARNAFRGSRESITLLSSEFRSLDPTWSPTLHIPEYRMHEKTVHTTFNSGSVLTETINFVPPPSATVVPSSSGTDVEGKLREQMELIRAQDIKLQTIIGMLHSFEATFKSHREDESQRGKAITQLIETWGSKQDAAIQDIHREMFPHKYKPVHEDFSRVESTESDGRQLWLWIGVVVVAMAIVYVLYRPKEKSRYNSKDLF